MENTLIGKNEDCIIYIRGYIRDAKGSLGSQKSQTQLSDWTEETRQEAWVRSLGQEDLMEEERAVHSSIFAWEIWWTEEPGGLQYMGPQRVAHDRATKQQQQQQ